ncbi:yemanuclein [Malaya genurostris]|uniref:yemanuclein n=1 Tax=Malaya genurostris TaxID=325434 RepID=UPI0026F38429|nr:yemanuclein [Malaya genurostris]
MSEMKRVTLTTIGDAVKKSPFGGSGFDQNTENFFSGAFAGESSAGPNAKTGAGSKPRKTIRLELELFEPTTKSFPEFNYSKLAREEQKRQRKIEKKTTNGFLTEPDDNDDVARIAKELEKKYGSGTAYSSSGKFARPSQLDYCDRGAGYDEEDSFIDNTEAYDELIPQEVETVGGGFYINSGQLEFKTLSNFERPEDAIRMPKPKKRLLSSSSDSSEPAEVEVVPKTKAKKKDEIGSGTSGAESAGKSGKVGRKRVNGHVLKKAKVSGQKPGRKSTTSKEEKKKVNSKESAVAGQASAANDSKVIKTTTVKDMLRAKRDSLRKMEQDKKGRSSGSVSSSEAEEVDGDDDDGGDDTDGSDGSDSDSSGSGSDDSDSDTTSETDQGIKRISEEETKKRNEIKLPDNLPDHLVQDLTSLKDISKNTNGKLNFFDATVADLLLQIDVSSRMCGGSARNAIYKHLESHLQVSRQTLMVKIKKIRIRKEDNKVKKALGVLEDAVTEMMPKLITSYETEKQKVHDLRLALSASSENGEKPDIKTPRKKFPWNDHLRSLLCDVVTVRKKSFQILRPRKETEDEYVQSYLKKQVVPLWPSGWVKFEDLLKELDRRKKAETKATNKEVKKNVHQSASTLPVPTATVIVNGPSTSKVDSVLSLTAKHSKSDEKKIVRPPQSSPVASTSMSQPSPSTSPAGLKKTSDHSIINIISSPPSKSSLHSSHLLPHQQQQQQQQPPRPQSQPPRPPSNFDEDLIQTHVINLEMSHNEVKNSSHISSVPMDFLPKDLRVNSPALSSASSASSSRRQSSYQETPPMAHSNPASAPVTSNRRSRDDDSDSSIEIIGEYNVADKHFPSMEKKVDPLNLALPVINKEKYKKGGNSSKSNSRHSSGSGSSPGMGTSGMNINNNLDKTKYGKPSTITSTAVGGFVLPTMAGLMQDLKSTSSNVQTKMGPIPGELDVIRIMKELQELQAIQMNSISKTTGSTSIPKPSHSLSTSTKKPESSNHLNQSTPPVTAQHQQQSHHRTSTVNINGSGGKKNTNGGTHAKVFNPAAAAVLKKATGK